MTSETSKSKIGKVRYYDPLLEKVVECDSSWFKDYENLFNKKTKYIRNVITLPFISPKENKEQKEVH